MVPEQESCHYNLSLVLFIPFWLLLISLVGSSFSASSWKTGAPQGLVLGPLFWFYSPPLPGDLIWSSTTFFNYHPHWIEAQVQLFSPGLFSDIRPLFRLPPGHFHSTLSVPMLCFFCLFFSPVFHQNHRKPHALPGLCFQQIESPSSLSHWPGSCLILPLLLTPAFATSADFP